MISKPGKLIGKALAALLALPIILVVVFILINSFDRAPSPTAVEFQQAWDNRESIETAANGYIYLFGFDAAIDDLPQVVGEKRIQLSNDLVNGIASNKDLFHAKYNLEKAISPDVKPTFDQCTTINKACTDAIEKNKTQIVEWTQEENIVGERYAQLIAHPRWRELAPTDINLPIPSFGEVMKAQRFTFISEFARWQQEDTSRFIVLLDADLRFWRTVLRDTDMLIAKMVAVHAIKNNFLWTNYFLLSLDSDKRAAAIPVAMQHAFTDEELSMRRCFIGEWVFTANAYDHSQKTDSSQFSEKLAAQFLFKKQDTLNHSAVAFKKLIDQESTTLAEFETVFIALKESSAKKPEPKMDSPDSPLMYYVMNPYNPIGKILLAVAAPAYEGYSARVKDLETFRRGLLASIELMSSTPEAEVKYASPYKTRPFVINQGERSVKVNGLGEGANAQLVYAF